MVFVVGEILVDIFPHAKRIGGAPFNFAYHLKRLGFPVRFVSRIGKDRHGHAVLDRVAAAGFDPDDIQMDAAHPTGTVQVQLDDNGSPKFDITPDVAFDYLEFTPLAHGKRLQNLEFLYFGTLVQRTDRGFRRMQRFLRRNAPGTIHFYDINLRPRGYTDEVIGASLPRADILKLNLAELQECMRLYGFGGEPGAFISYMMTKFSLNMVALTKGDEGSELHTQENSISRAAPPVAQMADTVGAGDAFAAMLSIGILKKWPLQRTHRMAADFASRICSIDGAIPESANFYKPLHIQIENGG